ncbi:MAG: L-threonylcarbamoyladenylate synthase [Thermoflexibacter sp.]|jgi:tRNA threonylcarbamoyl adenosine modification protein (Sua5/YciO/YrdC/YwlC family)|nr:L-threonylcarbamoyladenylate synthase [Thermoflexibacter sp.]
MAELIQIHPDNPEKRKIQSVVNCLKDGGVIIYPTDTVYGLGCDLYNQKAIERVCRFKGIKPDKMHLSFICYDLSEISRYAKHISTPAFRLMKKALPGAYTFILESSSEVPKILNSKKKQVGIRVPDHEVPRQIVKELGNPILTTSVKDDDEIIEYMTEPYLIEEKYGHLVDMIVDSGYGGNIPSTVISCLDDDFEIIREGAGDVTILL